MLAIGTLVKVTADHPDGVTDNTNGEIGVITKIERWLTMPTDYTVHNQKADYVYGKDQIREITDEEAAEELYRILMR